MNTRDKLIELFYENNVRCDQTVEDLADDVLNIINCYETENKEIREERNRIYQNLKETKEELNRYREAYKIATCGYN